MDTFCDICTKPGKLGNTIMTRRVEGTVIKLCRKCENDIDDKPRPTRSLIDRMRGK